MRKKVLLTIMAVLFALVLAGCAEEQPSGDTGSTGAGSDTAAGETTSGETTVSETTGTTGDTTIAPDGTTSGTTGGMTGGGTTVSASGGSGADVAVGGFVVETPNAPDTTVPEAEVSQEDAREYLDQVQPIIENSVQDFSNLADPEVSIQNGSLTLDVPLDSLESTRGEIRDGLDELRQIEPSQSLEPINQQLIESYEQVLPAYTDIIEAAEAGDVDRLSNAVQENLPRIERFNSTARSILQDLEQAAGNQ